MVVLDYLWWETGQWLLLAAGLTGGIWYIREPLLTILRVRLRVFLCGLLFASVVGYLLVLWGVDLRMAVALSAGAWALVWLEWPFPPESTLWFDDLDDPDQL